jgi:hypothetical protein
MAVIYAAALRTTRMGDVVTAIGSNGKLKIYAANGTTLLATLPLSATAGTVSGDVLTFGTITSDTSADATDTAALATITTSADAVIVSGLTVGVGTGNIQLNTTSIVSGATVAITSGTLTHNTAG